MIGSISGVPELFVRNEACRISLPASFPGSVGGVFDWIDAWCSPDRFVFVLGAVSDWPVVGVGSRGFSDDDDEGDLLTMKSKATAGCTPVGSIYSSQSARASRGVPPSD